MHDGNGATRLVDPRTKYPTDLSAPPQRPPGGPATMHPPPDHGEATYQGSGRLAGRRAVVTGGDSGIGRAVVVAFAREGADVLLTHLPEEAADAEASVGLVTEAGRKGVAVAVDLTDEAACDHVVERAVSELGGIDLLVNNAAYQMGQYEGLEELTTDQLDRVMRTNLYALFFLCRAAVRHLPAGSSIINTTSIEAYDPAPPLIDYATTKAGIVNATKALSLELAPKGIRVNAVAPGPIWTPLIPATLSQDKVERFGKNTPLGRAGQPAELAPAYVFLASDDASYITGEVLGVTGGRLLP